MPDQPRKLTDEQLRWWREGYDTAKLALGARIQGLEILLAHGGPCEECRILGREVERLTASLDAERLGGIDAANDLHEAEERLKTCRAELTRLKERRSREVHASRLRIEELEAALAKAKEPPNALEAIRSQWAKRHGGGA